MIVRDGTQTVASAGTRIKLILDVTGRTDAYGLIVTAPSGNTGDIFIGGATVSSTSGLQVVKGTVFVFPPLPPGVFYDLNQIYIDAANANDKCKFTYFAKK